MDFRKYATRETSEVVGKLVAGASEKVVSDLQALRQAFDMVTGALDAAIANQAAPDVSAEVAQLADRLAAEAGAQAEAMSEEARRQAQASIDELRALADATSRQNEVLAGSLKEAQEHLETLERDIEARKKLAESLRGDAARAEEARKQTEASLEEACRHAEAILEDARRQAEAELEKSREATMVATEQLRAAHDEIQAARDEASRAAAQRDAEATRAEKMSAALSAVTTDLQEAKAQLQEARAQNKSLADRAAAAAADLESVRKTGEDHERAAHALEAKLEKAAKDAQEHEAQVLASQAQAMRKKASSLLETSLDRLLALYDTASGDPTLEDVLAAVVDAMAAQFSRVAMFRVQSNHLEGIRHVGFDLKADISQVLIPRTLDSLVTQAVTSERIETRSGSNLVDTSGMPFGGTPRFALALPLLIDGEALAVVYADDSDQAEGDSARAELRVKFAQLLQQQALPLLGQLITRGKALAELDEYAALLLTELEQTYTAEVAAGTEVSEADRRKHLRDNIDYARRLYAERAAPEGPRAGSLFEQRLFTTVEARAETPFGRDVAAAIGGRKRVKGAAARAHTAAS